MPGRYPEVDFPKPCILVGVALIIYLVISITFLILTHIDFIESLSDHKLLKAHIFCGGFGMFGATIAAMRKYYKNLISFSTGILEGNKVNSDWSFGWIYYYLTRPILGGALGAMTYLLSFLGFQVLSESSNLAISVEGNLLLYSLAFISGFSVSHVLDKLEASAKQIFQKIDD